MQKVVCNAICTVQNVGTGNLKTAHGSGRQSAHDTGQVQIDWKLHMPKHLAQDRCKQSWDPSCEKEMCCLSDTGKNHGIFNVSVLLLPASDYYISFKSSQHAITLLLLQRTCTETTQLDTVYMHKVYRYCLGDITYKPININEYS